MPIILIPKYNSVSVAYVYLKEEYEGLTENKEGGQTMCVSASACAERDRCYFENDGGVKGGDVGNDGSCSQKHHTRKIAAEIHCNI